ncbi:zinc/iron-chelating domain-containing protein [Halobacteriales archaeon QH_8_64_26]|nr:MAG: zinc/iron-chelating domain-containing protein [Halobacteriales archaeon QH_8_64_26]
MESLEAELEAARELSVAELADAIEGIGFECTRCGACCKAAENADDEDGQPSEDGEVGTDEPAAEEHTATVFPDEVRRLQDTSDYDQRDAEGVPRSRSDSSRDWRDVARPMPYGIDSGEQGPEGETFEWALGTDGCGDCTFYAEDEAGVGTCTVHEDRPLICRTYPFSVALAGTSQPMGGAVSQVEEVRAHECEGLGRDISRADAEKLAGALKQRAIRELEEAIAVRENYEPANPNPGEVVVHDSEGAKRPDGTPIED